MSEKRADMSHGKPRVRAGARRCRAMALVSAEGDQALQILDDGGQGELSLHSSQAPPSGSRESMLILALGKKVLASDTELTTDVVALCLVDITDPVTSLSFLQLSIPCSLLLQVERAPLPGRQLLVLVPPRSGTWASMSRSKRSAMKLLAP